MIPRTNLLSPTKLCVTTTTFPYSSFLSSIPFLPCTFYVEFVSALQDIYQPQAKKVFITVIQNKLLEMKQMLFIHPYFIIFKNNA